MKKLKDTANKDETSRKKVLGSIIKNESTIFLFRKMWSFAGELKLSIILMTILYMFSNAITLLPPIIYAWFINEIQANGVSDENIWKLIGITSLPIVTTFLFWIFHGAGRIIEHRNATLLRITYKEHLLAGVLALDMNWHSEHDSGDTIDKINRASNSLFNFADRLFDISKILFGVIGTIIAIMFFNVYIAIFVLLTISFSWVLLSKFDKILVNKYKKLEIYDNKISAGVVDTITNITTVLILNIQKAVLNRIHKLLIRPVKETVAHSKLGELKWFTGSILFDALVVVLPMMFYLVYELHLNHIIAVGTITALYLYLQRMSDSFFSFGYMYEIIMYNKARIENIDTIEKTIEANKQERQKKKRIVGWQKIRIDNLNFSYDSPQGQLNNKDTAMKALHLNNVSLSIKKGERIAFIGESGSGKTTFLKVLHGLYDSSFAQLEININKKKPEILNTNFADLDINTMLVPQEPEVFSSTIKENITLGLPTKRVDLEKAIKLAQFKSVLKKLPKGLKSIINEKGVNLSGGQKQRLALTRALLFAKDKDVILLDESTSSVDPENEVKIYQNIFKEFKDKTILASIHKMNLLKYFDRIIIFKNGKVLDEGTFNELLKKNKKFKKDWNNFVEKDIPV